MVKNEEDRCETMGGVGKVDLQFDEQFDGGSKSSDKVGELGGQQVGKSARLPWTPKSVCIICGRRFSLSELRKRHPHADGRFHSTVCARKFAGAKVQNRHPKLLKPKTPSGTPKWDKELTRLAKLAGIEEEKEEDDSDTGIASGTRAVYDESNIIIGESAISTDSVS